MGLGRSGGRGRSSHVHAMAGAQHDESLAYGPSSREAVWQATPASLLCVCGRQPGSILPDLGTGNGRRPGYGAKREMHTL